MFINTLLFQKMSIFPLCEEMLTIWKSFLLYRQALLHNRNPLFHKFPNLEKHNRVSHITHITLHVWYSEGHNLKCNNAQKLDNYQ